MKGHAGTPATTPGGSLLTEPVSFVKDKGLLILQAVCGTITCLCVGIAWISQEEQVYSTAVNALYVAGFCAVIAYIAVLGSTPLFNEENSDCNATKAKQAKWGVAVFLGGSYGAYFISLAWQYEEATNNPVVITGTESKKVEDIAKTDISVAVTHSFHDATTNKPIIEVLPVLTIEGLGKKETRIPIDERVFKESFGLLIPYRYKYSYTSWNERCDLPDSGTKTGFGQEGFSIKSYLACLAAGSSRRSLAEVEARRNLVSSECISCVDKVKQTNYVSTCSALGGSGGGSSPPSGTECLQSSSLQADSACGPYILTEIGKWCQSNGQPWSGPSQPTDPVSSTSAASTTTLTTTFVSTSSTTSSPASQPDPQIFCSICSGVTKAEDVTKQCNDYFVGPMQCNGDPSACSYCEQFPYDSASGKGVSSSCWDFGYSSALSQCQSSASVDCNKCYDSIKNSNDLCTALLNGLSPTPPKECLPFEAAQQQCMPKLEQTYLEKVTACQSGAGVNCDSCVNNYKSSSGCSTRTEPPKECFVCEVQIVKACGWDSSGAPQFVYQITQPMQLTKITSNAAFSAKKNALSKVLVTSMGGKITTDKLFMWYNKNDTKVLAEFLNLKSNEKDDVYGFLQSSTFRIVFNQQLQLNVDTKNITLTSLDKLTSDSIKATSAASDAISSRCGSCLNEVTTVGDCDDLRVNGLKALFAAGKEPACAQGDIICEAEANRVCDQNIDALGAAYQGKKFFKIDKSAGPDAPEQCKQLQGSTTTPFACDGYLTVQMEALQWNEGECKDKYGIDIAKPAYEGIKLTCSAYNVEIITRREAGCTGAATTYCNGGTCDQNTGKCICKPGKTGKQCNVVQKLSGVDFCSNNAIVANKTRCEGAKACCKWQGVGSSGNCLNNIGNLKCNINPPDDFFTPISDDLCTGCVQVSVSNGLCDAYFADQKNIDAMVDTMPSYCETCATNATIKAGFLQQTSQQCASSSCTKLECNREGGCVFRSGSSLLCKIDLDKYTSESTCTADGADNIYCGNLAQDCTSCVTTYKNSGGCQKSTVFLPDSCQTCEAQIIKSCPNQENSVESAAVDGGASQISDDCENCQKVQFRWRIDFADKTVFRCEKFLGEEVCNQVNLYFIFDKSKIGAGADSYMFVNLDFQTTADGAGQTRRNIVQSVAHTKVGYAFEWNKETSLDGSSETLLFANQIRYGEEPQIYAPSYVKASFQIPIKSGKAVWKTAQEQLAFTLNGLWTSIVATSSLVGGLFMFFFPNIMHKSYFRFADWRPDVEKVDVDATVESHFDKNFEVYKERAMSFNPETDMPRGDSGGLHPSYSSTNKKIEMHNMGSERVVGE